jgi:hypothetical protein
VDVLLATGAVQFPTVAKRDVAANGAAVPRGNADAKKGVVEAVP